MVRVTGHTFLLSSISCSNIALNTGDLAGEEERAITFTVMKRQWWQW